ILCCSGGSEMEARGKIAAYVPLLCNAFPDDAFSDKSLGAVASDCKFFPSYGELYGLLGTWWRNQIPINALTGPDSSEGAKWARRSAELRTEWDDPENIRRRVQQHARSPLLMGLLGGAVKKWAPQHLCLIPPEYRDDLEAGSEQR